MYIESVRDDGDCSSFQNDCQVKNRVAMNNKISMQTILFLI
jgi:hypothetical protein